MALQISRLCLVLQGFVWSVTEYIHVRVSRQNWRQGWNVIQNTSRVMWLHYCDFKLKCGLCQCYTSLLARVLPVFICHLVTFVHIWMPFQVKRCMVFLHHEHSYLLCYRVEKCLCYIVALQGYTRNTSCLSEPCGSKGYLSPKTTKSLYSTLPFLASQR